MKHTPGLWEVMIADARLIAAAPDLLEACQGLLDMITDNRLHGPEVFFAADAIAKAGGVNDGK